MDVVVVGSHGVVSAACHGRRGGWWVWENLDERREERAFRDLKGGDLKGARVPDERGGSTSQSQHAPGFAEPRLSRQPLHGTILRSRTFSPPPTLHSCAPTRLRLASSFPSVVHCVCPPTPTLLTLSTWTTLAPTVSLILPSVDIHRGASHLLSLDWAGTNWPWTTFHSDTSTRPSTAGFASSIATLSPQRTLYHRVRRPRRPIQIYGQPENPGPTRPLPNTHIRRRSGILHTQPCQRESPLSLLPK